MAVHWGGRGPGHVSRNTFPNVAFSPLALFVSGEQGFWYDPSDLGTVWQDSARTIPGAVGSPVGCIDDKSGRGNNATQATTAFKPILRQDGALYYLEFDGTDDGMVTGTITPGVDKAQVFAGVRKLSNAAQGMLAETSVNASANNGSFYLAAPNSAAANYIFVTKGSLAQNFALSPSSYSAPISNIVTGLGDIGGDSVILRINGAQVASDLDDNGTGNYGAQPLYIGRRGGASAPFNGHIYSLIGRFGSNLDAATITQTETYTNTKTGAY